MKAIKSYFSDRLCFDKLKLDGVTFFWNLLLLVILPALVIILVITAGDAERQPKWDTGFLDDIDNSLIKRALHTPSISNSTYRGKIALLFLVRGPLPLEELWDRFLKVWTFCHNFN